MGETVWRPTRSPTAAGAAGRGRARPTVAARLRRSRPAVAGGALLAVVLCAAAAAPLLAPHDPQHVDPAIRLEPPAAAHLFGTDDLGRDVYSRILYGARTSLVIGASVAALTVAGAVVLGLAAGANRRIDPVAMRIMDGVMAFPPILLAIAIMASLGPRVGNVIAALSVVYIPRVARVVRSQVLGLRGAQFVEAAQASGAAGTRIIARHVLPNTLSPVIVEGTVRFAFAVLAEAALSFLGAGVPPDMASWGEMLSDGRAYIQQAPWLTLFPGAAIMMTVLGLNLLGDGLRDVLDPRSGAAGSWTAPG